MSEERHIVPRFKLLLSYDITTNEMDSYYQFAMGELVPALQAMGLYMLEAWHTAYGPYPIRLIGFVSEDVETIYDALDSDTFRRLESKFQEFIANYSRRVVDFREGFQFIENDAANGGHVG